MANEEIYIKAFEAYPVRRGAYGKDLNKPARDGYIRALIEQTETPEARITGWLARDKDGCLTVYQDKPKRNVAMEYWDMPNTMTAFDLPNHLFPEITWDDEPIEITMPIFKI